MRVGQAKEIARRWVQRERHTLPGYAGAFVHGSANWLADDAELPPTSDLDLMVVIDGPLPVARPGKLFYDALLLEVSLMPRKALRSPGQVLGCYHLAGSFYRPSVLDDPDGWLSALNAAVARDYRRRAWVAQRCAHALSRIERNLGGPGDDAAWPQQVMAWLFAAGVTCHVLLVAGLRNPTVRRRYEAVGELLRAYGRDEQYARLLELLGCAHWSAAQTAGHLPPLEAAYDAAGQALSSPYAYAADLGADARPVAIDGSRELIAADLHREAVFWMAATYSRCLLVLWRDAPPDLYARHLPGYQRLLAELGIRSPDDLAQRRAELRAFLPELGRWAEALMDANPEIID